MNLLDAAATIATTSDIDALFALYSQSRTYKNGGQVRKQIEQRAQEVASLNGYEGKFSSFRELVEIHDNETSPLWRFPISSDFLVAHQDYPLPYSFKHFLRLFKNTYDLRGFVYLGEGEQGLIWTKYKFLKDEEGRITFYASTRFATTPSIEEYSESLPSYEVYALDEIPAKALKEMFQPSEYLHIWDVRFASNFFEKVDAFVDGIPIVYQQLSEQGEVPFKIKTVPDRIYYVQSFDCGKMIAEREEDSLLLTREEFSLLRGNRDHKVVGPDMELELYVEMSDPTPYRELPDGERYATYSLLTAPFMTQNRMFNEEGLYKDLLEKYDLYLPGIDNKRYGAYKENVEHRKVFYVATYDQFTDEQIENFKTYGVGRYSIYVKYLPEHSGDIHYYQIIYAKLGEA